VNQSTLFVIFLAKKFPHVYFLSMNVDRESILQWIEDERRDREWLAEKCGVGLSAVGNWLGQSNPRPIPSKAVLIIRSLMEVDLARRAASSKTPQNLVLEFTDEEFSKLENAASLAGSPLRQLCKDSLDTAAEMDIAKIAEKYQSEGNSRTA
jgi:hypothetical protein